MSNKRETLIGIAFGIGAGLSYGVSSVLIKFGVGGLATPLVGASVSLLVGMVGLSFMGIRGIRTDIVDKKRGLAYLALAGVAAAGGITCMFFALSMAPVVVVTPLQSTNPLFALLLSWIFLGRLEKITPKLVIGSVLVVAGVILITLTRAS
ncbi:EamA family transporter [Chloroflexota bacterium]